MLSERSRKQLGPAIDLIRKGASLLKEACPRCGGVQVKFRGRTICIDCGDFVEVAKVELLHPSEVLANLKDLIVGKMNEATKNLGSESDFAKQSELVSLLLKYIELLEKVEKTSAK